jgi:hypothetical protein
MASAFQGLYYSSLWLRIHIYHGCYPVGGLSFLLPEDIRQHLYPKLSAYPERTFLFQALKKPQTPAGANRPEKVKQDRVHSSEELVSAQAQLDKVVAFICLRLNTQESGPS